MKREIRQVNYSYPERRTMIDIKPLLKPILRFTIPIHKSCYRIYTAKGKIRMWLLFEANP